MIKAVENIYIYKLQVNSPIGNSHKINFVPNF